ncbi:uncharacterized protein N7515_002191 [Penicillium bovifimosum]|uniref:Uncharacterized protein n=1 Tax=Penicillium bovifimosum TaxID=126998 RepID=A0A9W9HBE2_9EURO|nr:uncharacterized protein N7515_002191 [Penicillium bovifimosum]KAJ5143404.1 hypothetical protein N7515_002191 [Penicillium bovifimosum]
MPASREMSRYDHLKAVFARRLGQDPEIKDDSRSEITLVPKQPSVESHKRPKSLPNFNAADMCFGSCCRNN